MYNNGSGSVMTVAPPGGFIAAACSATERTCTTSETAISMMLV